MKERRSMIVVLTSRVESAGIRSEDLARLVPIEL